VPPVLCSRFPPIRYRLVSAPSSGSRGAIPSGRVPNTHQSAIPFLSSIILPFPRTLCVGLPPTIHRGDRGYQRAPCRPLRAKTPYRPSQSCYKLFGASRCQYEANNSLCGFRTGKTYKCSCCIQYYHRPTGSLLPRSVRRIEGV
jgi:hypothetical protein